MKLFSRVLLVAYSWLILSSLPVNVMAVSNTGLNDTLDTNLQSTVDNEVTLETSSGATSLSNTETAENVSTGEASSVATIITLDQTAPISEIDSYNLSPEPGANSDITFSPSKDSKNQQQATVLQISGLSNDIVTTAVNLSSSSGNTNANDNTQITQLTTGDAYANANVINILGSNLITPDLFLGYVTVKGDLTGDILLSSDLLQSVLNPTDVVATPQGKALHLHSKSYVTNNNISSTANSGNLNLDENGKLGNSVSGKVANLINTFDVVGANLSGESGLLVFVNVVDKWDGIIVTQSPSIKAALIGATDNGTLFYSDISPSETKTLTVTNDINVSALSGSIDASRNSKISNIASGDATTVVNVANILGSNLFFSKQFGIIFITVIGNWYGSFGVDTPYGGTSNNSVVINEEVKENSSKATPSQQTTTYFSISRVEQMPDDSKEQYLEINNQGATASITNKLNPKTSKPSPIKDYMIWGVPFIGGTIALGLLKSKRN